MLRLAELPPVQRQLVEKLAAEQLPEDLTENIMYQ